MLKNFLYLYNDGHNPFPHMKGHGFGFIPDPNHPDRMDLQYYADDDMTQEEADRLNGILPELEEEAGRERLAEIERLYPERFIPTVPTKQEYDFEKYREEYEDEYPMEDYDDELENINDQIKEIKKEIIKITKGDSIDTYSDKLKLLDEEEKAEKKNIITIRIQQQKISDSFPKLSHIADVEFMLGIKKLTEKQRDRILELFEDIMQDVNKNSNPNDENDESDIIKRILTGVKKIVIVTKQPEIRIIRRLLDQGMEALNMPFFQNDKNLIHFLKKYTTALMKIGFPDEMKTLSDLGRKEMISKERLKEIKEDKQYMTEKLSYIDTKNEEIKIKQKHYGERKKLLDHKKRLADIKTLQDINPEQALKDALELNAELKEKESLAKGQQLSKSAQKKAKLAEKKALAEKQAEAPVINAQSALASKGTYGKKLEDFFTQDGQPILQKFTGDKSEIHDIEKQEIIPDEIVTFKNKKKNSLRKACTLDLYSDKFVFEIKNYVNNSIKDDVIPMQPSKFAGTEYFVPTYLEDGRLYSLNLKYISPKTGIHHTQNILPPNSHGREVVFVIRLKEGLFQYKPFLDKENNKLILNGEFASGKRPLYFFDETKLKKCKDYEGNPAFNLKGHLDPI